MRMALLALAIVGLGGCTQHVALRPAAEAPDDGAAPQTAFDPVRVELLAELRVVEERLAGGEGDREALLRRRLAIAVALAARPSAPELRDAAEAIADAERRIAERRRARDDDQTIEKAIEIGEKLRELEERAWAEERRAVEERSKGEQAERRYRAQLEKQLRRGCAPGDPLCADLGEEKDGSIAGKDAPDSPPVEPPSSRPGPAEDKPEQRSAARVAEGPPPSGVLREVRRQFGRVEACVPRDRRDRERQLKVQMIVHDHGGLDQVRVSAGDLARASTACIEDVFTSIRVADYHGDTTLVSLPLWIRAAQ